MLAGFVRRNNPTRAPIALRCGSTGMGVRAILVAGGSRPTKPRSRAINTRPLDATYAAELLQRQHLLLAEARQVLADLDLMSCLGQLGHAEHIGSSVSVPMV